MTRTETIHATVVVRGTDAILLRGPAGAGKSDLALRLIDRGAMLVADDRVILEREGERIVARPPDRLAGWLEVAGVGPLPFPHRSGAAIRLVCDLERDAPRHPLDRPTEPLFGIDVRRIRLDPRAASAPLVIETVLDALEREVPQGLR